MTVIETPAVNIRRAGRSACLLGFMGSFADAAVSAAAPLIAIQSRTPLIENAWLIFIAPVAILALGAIPLGILFDRIGPRLLLQWTAGAGIVATGLLFLGDSAPVLAAATAGIRLVMIAATIAAFAIVGREGNGRPTLYMWLVIFVLTGFNTGAIFAGVAWDLGQVTGLVSLIASLGLCVFLLGRRFPGTQEFGAEMSGTGIGTVLAPVSGVPPGTGNGTALWLLPGIVIPFAILGLVEILNQTGNSPAAAGIHFNLDNAPERQKAVALFMEYWPLVIAGAAAWTIGLFGTIEWARRSDPERALVPGFVLLAALTVGPLLLPDSPAIVAIGVGVTAGLGLSVKALVYSAAARAVSPSRQGLLSGMRATWTLIAMTSAGALADATAAPQSGEWVLAPYYAGTWLLICGGLLFVAFGTLFGRRLTEQEPATSD